ncbi:GntR family transcriptional regulator [Planctomicrobium sp. SH664]|uniref:GntR family transcriptional regulator n=1 Tax=Planctomicrobium sp. SH664 TaxID=3448125 RepID=UPI003F5B2922
MTIVEHIKVDLRDRIHSGRPLPQKMTLESLANLYQVSVTPVRAALRELIAEGLLIKGDNRRLTPAKVTKRTTHSDSNPRPVIPPDPNVALLGQVTKDLVLISLEGKPVYIREKETAEKYQVTRSALRNILHRLTGSGLLEHLPRRGWVIRPFRQEDMWAFLEVREMLELKALDLSRPHLRDEDLQMILDGNQLPASEEVEPLVDNTLHAYLIDKAGNPYIRDFFERHGRYYEILFEWEAGDRTASVEAIHHHREILEALLLRDWKSAKRALSHHIRSNHPVLVRVAHRHGSFSNAESPHSNGTA